jgi:hypothetical protein
MTSGKSRVKVVVEVEVPEGDGEGAYREEAEGSLPGGG